MELTTSVRRGGRLGELVAEIKDTYGASLAPIQIEWLESGLRHYTTSDDSLVQALALNKLKNNMDTAKYISGSYEQDAEIQAKIAAFLGIDLEAELTRLRSINKAKFGGRSTK